MNDLNQNQNHTRPSDKHPMNKGGDPKNEKMNRIIYITAITLLLAVVIIAAVVSATNRATKEPEKTPNKTEQKLPENTNPKPEDQPSDEPSKEEPTDEPTDAPSEDVSQKLPTFVLPVTGALSVGHDPDMQVFSPTMDDYRVHLGIDVNTTEGAAVVAAADGKVEKVWEDVRMGWCVAVSHSGGAVTYYKNLAETLANGIEEGATVTSGQLLGAIGESAMIEVAQEPHLHFEITVGGIQVDPLEYFDDEALKSLEVDVSVEE